MNDICLYMVIVPAIRITENENCKNTNPVRMKYTPPGNNDFPFNA